MAKRRKDRKNWGPGYHDTDFEWMAAQFKKQSARNPNLTLEAFAMQHGVRPEWIRRFIDTAQNSVLVWHGTSSDRAESIMQEGFNPPRGNGKSVWLTRDVREARGYAARRSRARNASPVVFCCEIDLSKYPKYRKPNPNHYVFKAAYLDPEVIHSVSGSNKKEKSRKSLTEKKNRDKSIDITVTQPSGKLGVLMWLNAYLELEGKEPVSEDHSAVEAIYQWVETEYSTGREEPISNEEILIQVAIHLKQEEKIGEQR